MASAYFDLGVALADLGNIGEAKLAYTRVVEMEPLSASGLGAQCNLCSFVYVDDGVHAAAECFRRVVSVAPTYERSLVKLAAMLQIAAEAGSEHDWTVGLERGRVPKCRISNVEV